MTDKLADVQRKMRIVSLLHAASQAGQSRVERHWLHAVAYLSNALAPVWDAVPVVPEMLKTDGAPYDSELQHSLDLLVGSGVARVHDAKITSGTDGTLDLDAAYSLRMPAARALVNGLVRYPDEAAAILATKEIFLLLAGLPRETADRILRLDAAYDDPRVGENSLVDLYGSDKSNMSSNVTRRFGSMVGSGVSLNPIDEIGLYVTHLHHLAQSTG